MTIRFKLIAAVLGLAVATGAVADASANTIVKTAVTHKTVSAKTIKVVGRPLHRLHFGTRIVKHVRIAHRAPTLVKIVAVPAPKTFVKTVAVKTVGVRTFVTKKFVRLNKAPLQRHAMNHRIGTKVTIIR